MELNKLKSVLKPEYLLRPKQLYLRVVRPLPKSKHAKVALPWGHDIEVNPNESIGKSIFHLGFYEISLSEIIWRTLKSSNVDVFLDVGTNIGYFSSLALSHKSFKGEVFSFEPHPEIAKLAKSNLESSSENNRSTFFECALSDQSGEAPLYIPMDFESNEGIASLISPDGKNSKKINVKLEVLDEKLDPEKKYAMKIDVEGNEASVLRGATKLLASKTIEIIFFEEFEDPKVAETFKILSNADYKIMRIQRSFFGPVLVDPSLPIIEKQWEPTNFVAAPKGSKLWKDISKTGWQIIKDNH